jgi:glutathione peroxidase
MRKKYGIEFPLMEKIEVNGENAHPIFMYLRQNTYELKSKKDPDRVL